MIEGCWEGRPRGLEGDAFGGGGARCGWSGFMQGFRKLFCKLVGQILVDVAGGVPAGGDQIRPEGFSIFFDELG